jgi:transposase-like protein
MAANSPRSCTACSTVKRVELDAELARGCSVRDVARRYGISSSIIGRHRIHISREIQAAREAGAVQRGSALAQQVRELVARAQMLGEKAEAAADLSTALAACREMGRLLELVGRFTGELTTTTRVNLNVQVTPSKDEAVAIALDTLQAFAPHLLAGETIEGDITDLTLGPGGQLGPASDPGQEPGP